MSDNKDLLDALDALAEKATHGDAKYTASAWRTEFQYELEKSWPQLRDELKRLRKEIDEVAIHACYRKAAMERAENQRDQLAADNLRLSKRLEKAEAVCEAVEHYWAAHESIGTRGTPVTEALEAWRRTRRSGIAALEEK